MTAPVGTRIGNPAFERHVRASFARQGAMAAIGAELISVEPGCCRVRLPFSDRVSQQHGYFHGGLVATVGDSAGGYAAMTLFPPDTDVLTVEYKVNFMAPAKGDTLIATGRVLKAGRTLSVCHVEVDVIAADGTAGRCAVLQQTLMAVANAPR